MRGGIVAQVKTHLEIGRECQVKLLNIGQSLNINLDVIRAKGQGNFVETDQNGRFEDLRT